MNPNKPFPVPYLWPVGQGGFVAPRRVLAAGSWESAPIRRLARKAKAEGRMIDLTFGRACKWIIFLDSGHLVLAAVAMPVMILDGDEFEKYIIENHGEY